MRLHRRPSERDHFALPEGRRHDEQRHRDPDKSRKREKQMSIGSFRSTIISSSRAFLTTLNPAEAALYFMIPGAVGVAKTRILIIRRLASGWPSGSAIWEFETKSLRITVGGIDFQLWPSTSVWTSAFEISFKGIPPSTRRGSMAIFGLGPHIGKFKNCLAMKSARLS